MYILAAVLLPWTRACSNADQASAKQPGPINRVDRQNVVLLLFDDLRHDPFSFTGGPVHTPHIDSLARDGIVFQSAMTTTGLCSPSRAALFTGRWGLMNGLEDNTALWHTKATGLDPDQSTVIEWALEKGYRVGYFGKWHLGNRGPDQRGAQDTGELGIKGGTDVYVPVDVAREVDQYYLEEKEWKEKPLYYKTLDGTYEETVTADKVSLGIGFIRKASASDDPFFLTVSFNQPHPPYRIPEPYASMFDHGEIVLPESLNDDMSDKPLAQRQVWWPWHDVGHMTRADWQKATAHFYGAVAMIDHAVGEVIQALRESGSYEKTMIIVVGDQGSMIGEHGLYDKGPYSYDVLMRIPLIIRAPGYKPREVSRQVSILDLNQTLVEWMDLEPLKENLHSRSLFPLIEQGDQGWEEPDEAFYHYEWYNGSWFGIRTIRTPGWKYCWNPSDLDELYDLVNDPGEVNNLARDPEFADRLRQLQERLLYHLESINDPLLARLEEVMGN
jgi:arylsulfatase A-like enzyme